MLLANPHLPWSDMFTWFEAQLKAPGIDAYGASLVGNPTLGIAFNDYLGWSHTVNTMDGADLYELTLAEDGYLWEQEIRPFDREEQVLNVRQADGTQRQEKLIIRRSVHGPVVAEKNGKALALRVVGLDQPHVMEQYWDMMRTKNFDEFQKISSRLQMPMFNTIYADRDGHIMMLHAGRVPKRPKGDWDYWQGIVPGISSETLWTATHAYDELPKVIDPPQGWVQNANDPPWTATFPTMLDPDDFPPYMSPRGMAFRPQRSARMLDEDDKITFDELLSYKHSTRMELADRLLDDLIPAAKQHDGALAKEAAKVLEAWDRAADADSRGAVLFAAWVQELGSGAFAKPWDENAPRTTPDGLADPQKAASALETAAWKVQQDHGALDVPWGEVYRLRYAGKDLPANGGQDGLGIFRVLWFENEDDKKYRAAGGDSYFAVVEFSNPIRAMALISYGNATQPGSPHKGDQLELFAKKQMRPVWRTRKEIEANLESKEELVIEVR
jgi:acyl-homoserine-lactone acylase